MSRFGQKLNKSNKLYSKLHVVCMDCKKRLCKMVLGTLPHFGSFLSLNLAYKKQHAANVCTV